jgi:hypothetical protein
MLTDLNGQLVRKQSIGRQAAGIGTFTIDCEALPTGLYIYQLKSGNGTFSGKIAIMH